jgi:hypothetical protein
MFLWLNRAGAFYPVHVKECVMKRRCFWTAAIILASGGAAIASGPMPALVAAQTESEIAPEGVVSPSDEPILEEALPDGSELAPPAVAPRTASPYVSGVSWSAGAAGCGCGMNLQCCERVPSRLDHVWDDYCAHKSHFSPVGAAFGLLHIKRSCQPACPPPACHGCDCRLGLPKLPTLGHGMKAPCRMSAPCDGEQDCQSCATYSRPRRSLVDLFRKPACCQSGCESLPGAPIPSLDSLQVADPGFDAPELIAPPAPPMPELPATEPSPQPQGWLPLPWVKHLPL